MARCPKCSERTSTVTNKCPNQALHDAARGRYYNMNNGEGMVSYTENIITEALRSAKNRATGALSDATIGKVKKTAANTAFKRAKCSNTGKKVSSCSCNACKHLKQQLGR